MIRIASEGWPFIVASGLLVVIVHLLGRPWMLLPAFILLLFMLFFFRDPERTAPHGKGLFIAPADGKVIVIRETDENEYIGGKVKQISIFMSPLNVHVNRAPCDGIVEVVKHTPGGFKAAYSDEASIVNENIAMLLRTEYGKVLVRQVAGFLARRAVCRVKPGDSLKMGERFGIIKFSSRVDLYLPADVEVAVREGERVRAGETVLARISH